MPIQCHPVTMKKLLRTLWLLPPSLLIATGCTDEDAGQKGAERASENPGSEPDTAAPGEASENGEASAAPDGADSLDSAAARGEPGQYHLPGPTLAGWEPSYYTDLEPLEEPPDGYSHLAVITGRQVGLFSEPGDRFPSGIARTGGRIPANPASGPGCDGGEWYEVKGGAYLCSSVGVHMTEERFTDESFHDATTALQRARLPRVGQPNLFQHGVAEDGAPFLNDIPSEAQIEQMREGDVPDELVRLHADGAYVLALADEVEAHGERFFQTIYGSYIRESDVDPRPLSPMHGEWLEDVEEDLPLAFSYRESELYCLGDEAAEPCGSVAKHARFRPRGEIELGGQQFVLATDELGVPREDLRIATSVDRPSDFGADEKWFHIDLDEQMLLAYEGDEPVFATLISSGREGFHTPTGSYRVDRKYHSKTMRGTGGDGRPYQVQEVPWALYYDGNYAAHGAYWHENFGTPQSHGCVNIPPLDARWLYYWGDLEVPEGWHAIKHASGTGIHVTGETPPDEEDRA